MMIGESFQEHYDLICKTIVNPVRTKLIGIIGEKKLNVSEIQSQMDNISMSNLSNHLSALYRVGVLGREKKGSFIYYFLTEPELLTALAKIKNAVASIVSKKNRMIIDSMEET